MARGRPSRARQMSATRREQRRAGRDGGVGRPRPVEEQPDRGAALGGARRGDVQRWDVQDQLASDGEPLAAGGEQARARTRWRAARRRARPRRPGGARSCRGPGAHGRAGPIGEARPAGACPEGRRCPRRRRPRRARRQGRAAGPGRPTTRDPGGRRPPGPGGSCPPRPGRPASPAVRRRSPRRTRASSRSRPTNEVSAGGSRATVLAGADRRDGLERPAQHLLLEPSQPGRGVEAELVAEPVAVAGEGGQRVDRSGRPGPGR